MVPTLTFLRVPMTKSTSPIPWVTPPVWVMASRFVGAEEVEVWEIVGAEGAVWEIVGAEEEAMWEIVGVVVWEMLIEDIMLIKTITTIKMKRILTHRPANATITTKITAATAITLASR